MTGQPSFETTQWSVVLAAKNEQQSLARGAIENLCARYWFPLFAFLRRRGYQEPEAEDLVQGFFVRVIEKGVFGAADRERGRFRTFLLSSLENFLSNEADRADALRRGGGKPLVSLDLRNSDGDLIHLIAQRGRPEDEFHRQWAVAVLDHVLETVRQEYVRDGKEAWFAALRPYLSSDHDQQPYAMVAETMGISIANVKVAVHRLRRRYRKQLELEIAATVGSPDEIDDEIQQLFQALGGH